jgi:hypothetical protein
MSHQPLTHDATASTMGTVYQLYVAVQKCFEMGSGQKVIIERYGDVTVAASQQLEIKHYGDPLTDGHLNFWNTLKNWMQDGFDETAYSALLLCTTQEIGKKSSLKEWNSKDVDGRLAILKAILSDAETRERTRPTAKAGKVQGVPESLRIQRWVMDPLRAKKLRNVVDRFIIADNSPDMEELYTQLKDVYAKGILLAKQRDSLNALLGFVLCPSVVVQAGWEITFDEFRTKVIELTAQYHKGTSMFPVKNLPGGDEPSAEMVETKKDDLFVQKIRDIDYRAVISKAIADHFYASERSLGRMRFRPLDIKSFQEVCLIISCLNIEKQRGALPMS